MSTYHTHWPPNEFKDPTQKNGQLCQLPIIRFVKSTYSLIKERKIYGVRH